jgi:glycosyltransferase involved in cell wall biosynthesis
VNNNIQGVSIIVCCYNSAERLPETLKHLALLESNEDVNWELIIVDNNSSDTTIVVCKEECKKFELAVP